MNRTLTLTLIGMALVASMTAALAWGAGTTGNLGTGGTKVLKCHLSGGSAYAVELICIAGNVNYDVVVRDPGGAVVATANSPGDEGFAFTTTTTGTYKFVITGNMVPGYGPSRGRYLFRIAGPSGDPIGW